MISSVYRPATLAMGYFVKLTSQSEFGPGHKLRLLDDLIQINRYRFRKRRRRIENPLTRYIAGLGDRLATVGDSRY
jgi:hypothetical protein